MHFECIGGAFKPWRPQFDGPLGPILMEIKKIALRF